MGDIVGSGVNEPSHTTLKKGKEKVALEEKVETDLEEAQNLDKRASKEGFNHLEMVWYEENREKAEHGVMEFSIHCHQWVEDGRSFMIQRPKSDLLYPIISIHQGLRTMFNYSHKIFWAPFFFWTKVCFIIVLVPGLPVRCE